MRYYANPDPPVEFFARGVDVEVAWLGGGTLPLDRQQLRDAARRRDLRADPEQAPGAGAVRAQDVLYIDRREHGR